MLGVVEPGEVGPTLFLWATDREIVIEPFTGGTFVYPSVIPALEAIERWAESLSKGKRVPFGSSQRR